MGIRYGFGFLMLLATVLAASSFFFRHDPPEDERTGVASQALSSTAVDKSPIAESKTESDIPASAELSDSDSQAEAREDAEEQPDSNLEIVFINLARDMTAKGFPKPLTDCIETQFRENLGIENPKDLDAMLLVCVRQFHVEASQSQQIKDVVLEAIAQSQSDASRPDGSSTQ